MLIDDIRLGESAELEFKRVPNDAPERWLRTVVALQFSALKAKGVLERKGGTRGVWRGVV